MFLSLAGNRGVHTAASSSIVVDIGGIFWGMHHRLAKAASHFRLFRGVLTA